MGIYHAILSIPPEECPPNHYRLLGLTPFESDIDVIRNAAMKQSQWVRANQLAFPQESQEVLDKLSRAKLCLCNPARKQEYDTRLRGQLANGAAEPPTESDPELSSSGSRAAYINRSDGEAGAGNFSCVSWEFKEDSDEPSTTAVQATEWLVGTTEEADVRIRAPWVSRRHCEVRRVGSDFYIRDLGSKNGTFVNSQPADPDQAVGADDLVLLGRKTRLPWPLPEQGIDVEIFSIGRSPECDYVLTDKSVSQHHAQLIKQGDRYLVQDLKSRNGVRVGKIDNLVESAEIQPHLSLFFGNAKVFASQVIDAVTDARRL